MKWEIKTIGELCHIEKGKIGITKAIPGEFPLVVTSEERKSHNEYHFDDEAVVIPLVSSTGHGHRSLKRIHYQTGKFAIGNILCAVIPKDKSIVNGEYLYHYLNLNREKELVSRMKGMANVSLPMKEIAKIEFPIPPLNEQKNFVEEYKLLKDSNSDLNNEIEKQLDLVKQLRQAFLHEAMQGKLTAKWRKENPDVEPASELLKKIKAEKEELVKAGKIKKQKPLPPIKEDEIPFEIPESWEWCRLEAVSNNISTGPFGTMLHKSDYTTTGIPLVNPMNIVDEKIIPSEKMLVNEETKTRLKSYVLKEGDIVIGRRGEMGRCAIVSNNESGWLCGTGSFFLKLSSKIYGKYFVKFMRSESTKSLLLGNSVGSTMNNLNHRILNNLTFPLPPLLEQQQIVTKLDKLMQYCDKLEESIKTSRQQNEMLLQQVLREALEPVT
jgi:type I restriction enzyme, S subunit